MHTRWGDPPRTPRVPNDTVPGSLHPPAASLRSLITGHQGTAGPPRQTHNTAALTENILTPLGDHLR